MNRRVVLLIALAACKEDDGDEFNYAEGDRELVYCMLETLDYSGGDSSNPLLVGERLYRDVPSCWDLELDIDRDEDTTTFALSRIDRVLDDGTLLGCAFTGAGNSIVGFLTEGGCVIPTETGHRRLTLTSPTEVMIGAIDLNFILFDLAVSWQEVREPDLVIGTGHLFMSRGAMPPVRDRDFDGRLPADPIEQCTLPTCVRADFAGRGTLVSGDPAVCTDWLGSFAQPFDVFLDAEHRMSFAANTPTAQRMPPVYDASACGVQTWSGDRPYPFGRYHLDAATSTMTMEHVVMHTVGPVTDVCTTRWSTTVTPCP